MRVEHTVVIDRPRADVWAAFDDPDLMVECESHEIGSSSLQTVKNVGIKSELTVTLLEREEPELSESHYEGAQVPFTAANTFTELDDGSTEWHGVLEVRLNLMQKALAPVLQQPMVDLVKRNGCDFKAFVEGR